MSTGGLSNTAELEEASEPWHCHPPPGGREQRALGVGGGQQARVCPKRDYTLSGKAHSHSGQSVLSTHNLNRQDFVEQGDTAKERGGHHKRGARGIIGTLPPSSQQPDPSEGSQGVQRTTVDFFNVICPQSISND